VRTFQATPGHDHNTEGGDKDLRLEQIWPREKGRSQSGRGATIEQHHEQAKEGVVSHPPLEA